MPDRKCLLHLRARQGKKTLLGEVLKGVANNMLSPSSRATVMLALDDDLMRRDGFGQPAQAFDASLECVGDALDNPLWSELGALLEPFCQLDLCAALMGENHVFVPHAPTPMRFQYCMRRLPDFSVSGWQQRYREVHSQYGLDTRGIEGYTQCHVDEAQSYALAQRNGFGLHRVDGVSELHMESLDAFMAEWEYNSKNGATEDEDVFVDRTNSVMWVSEEIYRVGY